MLVLPRCYLALPGHHHSSSVSIPAKRSQLNDIETATYGCNFLLKYPLVFMKSLS